MLKFEVGKVYKGNQTGNIYDCLFVTDDNALLINGKGEWLVSQHRIHDYIEYKKSVVEIRYADACLVNYSDGDHKGNGDDFKQHSNTTWWTRRKSGSDNIKATWIDGKLTSVEII